MAPPKSLRSCPKGRPPTAWRSRLCGGGLMNALPRSTNQKKG